MREILFRGKRITDNAWIKGDLQTPKNGWGPFITISGNGDKVFPETVGQYTGLKYKNGKRIFEGDIIRCGGKVVGVVNYHDCCFCVRFIMKDHANRSNPAMDIIENEYPNDIEVIGNIHDNKELLHDCEM